jgi:hypothetical protein
MNNNEFFAKNNQGMIKGIYLIFKLEIKIKEKNNLFL